MKCQFYKSKTALPLLCLGGMFLGFIFFNVAQADVCFLPMGGCVDRNALSTPENCAGYSTQKKNERGWNCATCNANGHTYYKCEEKTCGGGYTAGIESCARGFTHEYEKDAGGKYVYSGDKKCGKCTTPNGCADGTQLSPVCEQSGFKPVETQNYKGAQVCYACLDDNCYNGKKKECDWNTAWYNSREWYTSTARTQYGSTCYQCCNNKCSIGSLQVTCNSSTEQKRWRGRTNCGYSCYDCCNDVCSSGSKTPCASDEHPSYTTTTECGSTCYVNCVPNCSDECPVSTASKYVSCSTGFTKTISESTECGSSCYTCEVAGCARGFSTSVTSCSEGDKVCSGKSGDDDCCRCRKTCPSGAETTDKSSNGYSCDECEFENGSTGYVCTCTKPTEKSGFCYDCSDENDSNRPCQGKYHCKDRIPVGDSTCTCEDTKYYDKCLVEETCNSDYATINGVFHWASSSSTRRPGSGYYYVGEKCTTVELKKYYWWAKCNAEGTDANGGTPPAHGMKDCSDSAGGIGESVECGGKTYYDSCDECNDSYKTINGVFHWASSSSTRRPGSGYYYVGEKCSSGSKTYYWWAKCNDEGTDANGGTPPAHGMKDCSDSAGGIGESVECGGKTYYDSCDECNDSYKTINGVFHLGSSSSTSRPGSGYYYVGEKCSSGSKTYYWWAKCSDEGTDASGGTPPAHGMKQCSSNEKGYPTQVECGGNRYGQSCLKECNYNYKKSDCPDSFTEKCKDSEGTLWGECK